MRKLLLSFLSICFISMSYAQLVVANDSVHEEYNVSAQDLAVHNTHSTTAPPATFKWQIYSVDVPANWLNDYFVCDAIQCWDETKNTNTYDVTDNKQYALDVHFLNNGNVGTGTAELLIWQDGDSLNTFQIVKYTVTVAEGVNIQDVSKANISVYPNPVLNVLNIKNLNTSTISKVELYNVIGKKLVSIENPNAQESINMEMYDKGVYILKITDINQNNYSQNIIKN